MTLKMMLRGTTLFLLAATSLVFAQTQYVHVMVQVRPEMTIAPAGDSAVQLAVRLAPSASLSVWRADTCAAVPDNAQQVTRSGRQMISLAQLGSGAKVCALSSDGALARSLDLLP